MSDPIDWTWVGGKAVAGLGALAGWIGIRQIRRIDEVERTKLDRGEFNSALAKRDQDLDKLVRTVENMVQKADERGERIHQRMDEMSSTLIRLATLEETHRKQN